MIKAVVYHGFWNDLFKLAGVNGDGEKKAVVIEIALTWC